MASVKTWPAVEYENIPWERNEDYYDLIPKSKRRKIGATYKAAIPLFIANRSFDISSNLATKLDEISAMTIRFDERQRNAGYDLPALMLRSESTASSQIENLTSSVRNIAIAELSPHAPRNAKLIAGNVAAMRKAIEGDKALSLDGICLIHELLMTPAHDKFAGKIRDKQVWVGGDSYSPHGAIFVPPVATRLRDYLDDLVKFSARENVNPIAKAAVLHAQFETIHPFLDGNGRTGRALLAKQLRFDGIMRHTTLPVSTGLLHSIDEYMNALNKYHEGNIEAIIERVADAVEIAVSLGLRAVGLIDEILELWQTKIVQRKGSRIYDLPFLLVKQPVVNSSFVADAFGISQRAARDILELACEYEILRPTGNAKRGTLYQSDALIDIMEAMTSCESLSRVIP